MTEPAGDPMLGVTETNAGVTVMLVKDAYPAGVPDAR
jgi:hypothetical protein